MCPWLLPPRGRGLTVSASSLLRFLVSAVSRWRAPLISFTRLVSAQPRHPPYISTEQTETESRAATVSHTPTSGHLDWGPSWPAAQLAWDISEISGRIDWNLPSNSVLLNRRTHFLSHDAEWDGSVSTTNYLCWQNYQFSAEGLINKQSEGTIRREAEGPGQQRAGGGIKGCCPVSSVLIHSSRFDWRMTRRHCWQCVLHTPARARDPGSNSALSQPYLQSSYGPSE